MNDRAYQRYMRKGCDKNGPVFSSVAQPGGEPMSRQPDRGRRRDVDRRFDEAPGVRLFEDLHREGSMQRVTGAVRDKVTDDRVADEREIADRIQYLVADELVFESERVVEH